MQTSATRRRSAFSLIELIIVISVIVIIAAFTMPAMNTILRGSHLTQASGILVGQLNIARQQALSRNRPVEVRFYRYADPEIPGESVSDPKTGHYRAMQLFEVLPSGVALPIDKIQVLPGGTIFAYSEGTGLSSILDKASAGVDGGQQPGVNDKNAPRLPRGVDSNYEYASIRFNPDGSTNKSPTGKWFVTVVNINDPVDATKPPPNFFTVQVDPVTGVTRTFRPTAG